MTDEVKILRAGYDRIIKDSPYSDAWMIARETIAKADVAGEVWTQVGWYGPDGYKDNDWTQFSDKMRIYHQRPHSSRHGDWPGQPVYAEAPK